MFKNFLAQALAGMSTDQRMLAWREELTLLLWLWARLVRAWCLSARLLLMLLW